LGNYNSKRANLCQEGAYSEVIPPILSCTVISLSAKQRPRLAC